MTTPRPSWRAAALDPFALALQLTVLDLLLHPIGRWWIRPLVLALAAAALVVPTWLRCRPLWFALTALTAARVVTSWPLADNHAYLLVYWCLAVALSAGLPGAGTALASHARWMIGFVFAFAALWKGVLSPDYLNGTFFQVTLVDDPRFEGIARLFGGMTPAMLEDARQALAQHAHPGAPLDPVLVTENLRTLAHLATAATLVLEAAVATAFLWPEGRGLSRARDALLLFFCATTYAVAPVEGFGWLLLAMGVAQCDARRRIVPWLYLVVFGLVLLYREVPWALLLAERAGL